MAENAALIANRYNSTTHKPPGHIKKGPYLVPLLKRLLEKRIKYQDPETMKMIQGKVKDAVIWRLILNATEGETHAAKEILDRIDGKVTTPIEHSGEVKTGEDKIIIIRPPLKETKEKIGIQTETIPR